MLKNLVSEGVSIRPLGLILETLGEHAPRSQNTWELTEHVRRSLGGHIASRLAGASDRPIAVFTITQELQDRIATAWERTDDDIRLNHPAHVVVNLGMAIQEAANQMLNQGLRPIALVEQSIRPVVAELAFDKSQQLFVLGNREVAMGKIQVVGTVTTDQLKMVAA